MDLTYVAADKQQVFNSVFNDETQLNKLKAADGKKMNDAYLKERISQIEPRFGKVYEKASGYIHHSEVAFHTIASAKEPNKLELNIGHPLKEDFNIVLAECSEAFVYFLKLQEKLILPFIASKIKYDESELE